ncbi:LytTR family DNA-binding domain-containing protein [Falsiruegeria litorea]|nr:LytTR family DNA-binding domain-containing protein [Falsiruegeria litorea]
MTSGHPLLYPTLPDVNARLFYWILGIFLYLLLVLPWGELVLKLWGRLFSIPLPLAAVTAPLVAGITLLMEFVPDVFGSLVPMRSGPLSAFGVAKNVIVAHVSEMIAFLWLLPLSRSPEAVVDVPETSDDAARFIRIAGRSLPMDSVRCVRNEEHYLVVKTTMGTLRLRARMNDLLMQVSDDDGIQAHRSFWVSTDEALELRGTTIMTRSGCVIPVSRYRMKAVRAWCERHGKPH